MAGGAASTGSGVPASAVPAANVAGEAAAVGGERAAETSAASAVNHDARRAVRPSGEARRTREPTPSDPGPTWIQTRRCRKNIVRHTPSDSSAQPTHTQGAPGSRETVRPVYCRSRSNVTVRSPTRPGVPWVRTCAANGLSWPSR